MSGTTSSVTVAVDGFRPPFTAVQWQELEQQALIYKYLMAGLPVPTDLLAQIRRSLEALPARFFHHSALGYCSYYGKKFDPEPGRCRRTDGKKWRCSKDAYPDSKYCERHMHRGRNRSRKPVESQSTTQSLSTTTSQIITGSSTTAGGSFQGRGSGSFQNLPLYPLVNTESQSYGTSKFQMETSTYGLNNKEPRYLQEMTPDAADYNFLSETSNSAKGLGMDCNVDNTWRLMSSQVHSSPSLEPRNYSDFQDNSTQSHLPQAYELDATKQRQQYCFFGNDIGSLGPVKQEQNLRRPFFEELPKTRDAWSHLDDDGCNKNTSSTTQLSISMAGSEYLSRSVCSPNDAL